MADENEEIIGGKDRPVTGAALFATTISPMKVRQQHEQPYFGCAAAAKLLLDLIPVKELQELNINSPKEGPQGVESKRSDSPKPLTTKRGLQIEIAEENLEPPAKQLTPLSQATTPSDTPNGFGKKQSMLRQPTTARRSMRT